MEKISWGFGGRGGGGVGRLAGVLDDEVEVEFVGGAAALSWRKILAVRGGWHGIDFTFLHRHMKAVFVQRG
jgi:hypothetical protein